MSAWGCRQAKRLLIGQLHVEVCVVGSTMAQTFHRLWRLLSWGCRAGESQAPIMSTGKTWAHQNRPEGVTVRGTDMRVAAPA